MAKSPLGPYEYRGNIGRDANKDPIIPAQQTYVARLPSAQGEVYLWMGDLWGSRPDGLKGHDLQYWSSPLQFLPDGNIAPLRFEERWERAMQVGRETPPVANPCFTPKRIDPDPLTKDPCSGADFPAEQIDTGREP